MDSPDQYYARCQDCEFHRTAATYEDARRAATVHELVKYEHTVIAWAR